MKKELEILRIMKEFKCTWEEAMTKAQERKKLADFFS